MALLLIFSWLKYFSAKIKFPNHSLDLIDIIWFIKQRNDPMGRSFWKRKLSPNFLLNFFSNVIVVDDQDILLFLLFDILDLVLYNIIVIEKGDLNILKF